MPFKDEFLKLADRHQVNVLATLFDVVNADQLEGLIVIAADASKSTAFRGTFQKLYNAAVEENGVGVKILALPQREQVRDIFRHFRSLPDGARPNNFASAIAVLSEGGRDRANRFLADIPAADEGVASPGGGGAHRHCLAEKEVLQDALERYAENEAALTAELHEAKETISELRGALRALRASVDAALAIGSPDPAPAPAGAKPAAVAAGGAGAGRPL